MPRLLPQVLDAFHFCHGTRFLDVYFYFYFYFYFHLCSERGPPSVLISCIFILQKGAWRLKGVPPLVLFPFSYCFLRHSPTFAIRRLQVESAIPTQWQQRDGESTSLGDAEEDDKAVIGA